MSSTRFRPQNEVNVDDKVKAAGILDKKVGDILCCDEKGDRRDNLTEKIRNCVLALLNVDRDMTV